MDFNIYTLGDIEYVWSAFNGIALIFSQYKGVREFMTTAAVLAGLHLFYKSILWIQNPLKNELPVFNFIIGLILFSLGVTRVDVTLESIKTGEVRMVDDVPIFIAATASLTTNLSQGLLRDYKTAFDPLSPPDLSSTTLDDDLTLGPMTKFVKFMQWGGDSQGYCSQFPSPVSSIGNLNLCLSIQSVAVNCLKSSQNSSVSIPSKENIFNDIFSADLSDSLTKIKSAVKTGNANASARLIGTNGSVSKRCQDVWDDIESSILRPESKKIMETIGQVNGILSPEEAAGTGNEAGFASAMKAANGLYSKSLMAHEAMMSQYVMRNLAVGAESYKSALGVSADMELFEASMKRTNSMSAQGQLWLQLSGAAIAFLEMFAYMVAPFSLLMLIALGGNGISAAAKYLQLVVFVNMWPITAVMVNAYIKKVLSADLDTWTTLNASHSAVSWSGLPALAETYSSYLSVASALYAMIPVLTLFIMTQSIHPMMSAAKGVMPDAPVNSSHMTPQVWSAPDSGKSSFGDRQNTANISMGQGFANGGFNDSNLTSLGTWSMSTDNGSSFGQGAQRARSNLQSSQETFNQAFNRANETLVSGSHNQQFSQSAQSILKLADQFAANHSDGLAKQLGISKEQASSVAKAFIVNGGLNGGSSGAVSGNAGNAEGEKGTSTKVGTKSTVGVAFGVQGSNTSSNGESEKISNALQSALKEELTTNTSFGQDLSKSVTSLQSSSASEAASVKESFAQVQQASQSLLSSANQSVSEDAKVNGSTGSQLSQKINLDQVRDTMGDVTEDKVRSFARASGLDENAFMDKYKSHYETYSGSNAMDDGFNRRSALLAAVRDEGTEKIALQPGETVESNKKDLHDTSSMLKNLESMFGANQQQLDPAIRQLDKLSGDKNAEWITQTGERLQNADTGNVASAGQVQGAGANVVAKSQNQVAGFTQQAGQRPTSEVAGISVDNLNPQNGAIAVGSQAERNAANVGSESDRRAIQIQSESAVPMTPADVQRLQAEGGDARKTAEFFAPPSATIAQQTTAGSVVAAQNSLHTARTVQDADSYVNKTMSNDKLTPEEKKRDLLEQMVFTNQVARNTGDENPALKQAANENVETLRQQLRGMGVSLSRDEINNMSHTASRYNNGNTTLSDLSRAAIPDAGDSLANSYAPPTLGNGLPLHRPNPTSFDENAGKELNERNNDATGLKAKIVDSVFGINQQSGLTGAGNVLQNMGVIEPTSNQSTGSLSVGAVSSSVPMNVGNLVRLDNQIETANKDMGLTSDAATPYYNQRDLLARNINQVLTDAPEFGQDVAEKFKVFYSHLDKGMSDSEVMEKTREWLDENRKN